MTPHRDWSRRFSLALAMLVALSAALLSGAGLFGPIEDALTAERAELLSRPPTGEVAIVEVDARSLAQLRTWPWPRSYHARAVRELTRAGASVIAFDIDFSARSDSGDATLAAAIRDAQHVVLPTFEQKASDRAADGQVIASRPDAAFRDAWVGGVNIFPGADGKVRDYPAATFINGQVQPSIATLLAERSGLGDRRFQPDWAIDARQIPRFSFVDVMQGRISPAQLRGKRVLIGATAIELGDRYAVPRYGVVPGVVIQALAAESLLQERPIEPSGWPVTLAGIVLIAFLLAVRPLSRPVRYILAFCAVLLTALAIPFVAQRLWPLALDSAAWLYTALASAAVQAAVEARRRLRLRAEFDADSGLPNRSVLETSLDARQGAGDVLVTAAIERFEAIRDAVGIAATNEMIRNAAALIGAAVGGPVHRIAPDMLAWVQSGTTDEEVVSGLRKVQEEFRAPVETSAGPIDVTLTAGLERGGAASPGVLRIEHALAAIGTARTMGKSHDWYRGANPLARRQLSLMSELRRAMESGRLRIAYQPKLSLATGCIADAEALVRWSDESGRPIPPDEFIPLAEETGVIHELTLFALRAAAADLARWAQDGLPMRIAVNVSALDLATPDFTEQVEAICAAAGVPPSQLALEVTESALLRSPTEAINTLNAFRAAGFRLSVDDYGTGQSTLSYLKHLPVHELKIDKSFVTALVENESDAIMVRSTINLAHELGLEVVAEGIEDEATLAMLRRLGSDYAQGYFIGKAVDPDELRLLAAVQPAARRVA
jgi:EAL domain-containing protein (putative c-di-GMP-specific phosphodiesterase class I)/CHASE2 domain-containing sensor protein